MKAMRAVRGMLVAVFGCASLVSCAGGHRAMADYYRNHPEMLAQLLRVRRISLAGVRGAADAGEAARMRQCIVDELARKGRGRFTIAAVPAGADAVLETDMKEELGPVPTEEPLPFELQPVFRREEVVFLRIRLRDPVSGRVIYATNSRELPEVHVDSMEKAAHTVIRNLVREIDLARGAGQR